jgi:sulfate adenylyltransferase subunit 2
MRDDERMPLAPGEVPETLRVRFRTTGDWPMTAAHESRAETIRRVIAELRESRVSEGAGRVIDHDQDASMEREKGGSYL